MSIKAHKMMSVKITVFIFSHPMRNFGHKAANTKIKNSRNKAGTKSIIVYMANLLIFIIIGFQNESCLKKSCSVPLEKMDFLTKNCLYEYWR